jgi:hypothetical protein
MSTFATSNPKCIALFRQDKKEMHNRVKANL